MELTLELMVIYLLQPWEVRAHMRQTILTSTSTQSWPVHLANPSTTVEPRLPLHSLTTLVLKISWSFLSLLMVLPSPTSMPVTLLLETTPTESSPAVQAQRSTMLFWSLDMVLNPARTSGSSGTHGALDGVQMALSRFSVAMDSVALEPSAMLPNALRQLELSPILPSFHPHLQFQPAKHVMSPKPLELSLELIPWLSIVSKIYLVDLNLIWIYIKFKKNLNFYPVFFLNGGL